MNFKDAQVQKLPGYSDNEKEKLLIEALRRDAQKQQPSDKSGAKQTAVKKAPSA